MLHPTISNEECSDVRATWFTKITVPPKYGSAGFAGGVVTGAADVYDVIFEEKGPLLFWANTKIRPLQIPDTGYTPLHPQSISLEDCEGDWNASTVEFAADVTLPFDGKLEVGNYLESDPIPLYHSHVLWSAVLRLERFEDDKYRFRSTDKGAHLSGGEKKGPCNHPANQTPPPIKFEISSLLPNRACPTFFGSDPLTKQELLATADDGKMKLHIRYFVPRGYFSLDKIIDLEKKPTVSEANRKVVETILRGEKPSGADWSFPNECGTHRYHLHMATLAERCPDGKELLPYYSREKLLDDFGLSTAVRVAYGVEVPLPDKIYKDLFICHGRMFGEHFKKEVVPQWEREICRRALALNPRDPTPASLVELLFLLNTIWEGPIGWLPVAKRVAIGVLADMVHLNARSSVLDFVQTTILPCIPDSDLSVKHLPSVLGSMMKHLNAVSRVRKTTVDLSSASAGQFPALAPTVPHENVEEEESSSGCESSFEDEEDSSLASLESDPESVGDNEKNGDTVDKEDTVSEKIEIDEDTVMKEDTVDIVARGDWYDAESGRLENHDEEEWTCTIS